MIAADARRLADAHALYRMFDNRSRLLYIGITGDLGQRLGEHSFKRWFPLVEQVTLEWLPSKAAAMVAERRAISSERPRYNRAGVQPPKKERRTAPHTARRARREEVPEQPGEDRNILADLDQVLGEERTRLADIPALLRGFAPTWGPYRKMTGIELRAILTQCGVRTTNAGNVPRLDPADLRRVYGRPAT